MLTFISDEKMNRGSENSSDYGVYDSGKGWEYYLPSTNSDNNSSNHFDDDNKKRMTVEINTQKIRKRQRDVASWKCNVRKKAHDAGKEYLSVGKTGTSQKDNDHKRLQNNCFYQC